MPKQREHAAVACQFTTMGDDAQWLSKEAIE
jgi:hypothetical protein